MSTRKSAPAPTGNELRRAVLRSSDGSYCTVGTWTAAEAEAARAALQARSGDKYPVAITWFQPSSYDKR